MDKMLRLWGMFQQKIKASDVNINLFSKKKKKIHKKFHTI